MLLAMMAAISVMAVTDSHNRPSQTCRNASLTVTNEYKALLRLVHNAQNEIVRYVLCARAQAFVGQVCRAGPSATGRRATFSKLNEKPEIVAEMRKPRVS